MAARRCVACSRFLAKPAGRGRPSLRCSKCKPANVIVLRSCRDCGVELPSPEGRGRPAVRCDDCRKVLVNA